jgi:hypothetical protein
MPERSIFPPLHREGKVPLVSESKFLRKHFIIWAFAGLGAIIVGLLLGPRINHSHNPWLSVVFASAIYLVSLLLAPIALMRMWRNPAVSPAVLLFSVPVGLIGLGALYILRIIAPSYLFPERDLVGMALAILLLYGAALVWGIAVGIRRKQLGQFNAERVP